MDYSVWKNVRATKDTVCCICNKQIRKYSPVLWNVETKKLRCRKVCINPFKHVNGKSWKKEKQEYLGQEAYNDYLNSKSWKRKKAKYRKSGFLTLCWACESNQKIEYHHRTYNRLGNEAMTDLVTLCNSCHKDLTNQYKSQKIYSDNALWTFTTNYIDSKRIANGLEKLPINLFDIKLITNPRNSINKVVAH